MTVYGATSWPTGSYSWPLAIPCVKNATPNFARAWIHYWCTPA